MEDKQQFPAGISVTALVREMLVCESIMTYDEACRFSEKFDARLLEADWLETLNGTTFERTFDPLKGD